MTNHHHLCCCSPPFMLRWMVVRTTLLLLLLLTPSPTIIGPSWLPCFSLVGVASASSAAARSSSSSIVTVAALSSVFSDKNNSSSSSSSIRSNHDPQQHQEEEDSNTQSSWVVLVSKGLVNLGNTCYLNAQLECAYHIPKVRNLILEAATATVPTTAGGSVDTASAGTAAPTTDALMALQQVFAQMVSSSSSSSTTTTRSSATITPIRSFCRTLGINPLEQQDAQEFWKLLLPELDHTPLLELYQGTYDAFIKALDGTNRQRVRKEIFMDLSLDVVDYDHVMDSLQNMFTGGEILSVQDGNGWRPDKGSQETVDAIKGNRLVPEGLPKILQLHLKRFRHDWELGSVSKINDRFVFEKVLDLQSVFEENGGEERKKKEEEEEWWLYDLQSVVVHVGEYGSGHYYAYVRPDVQKDEWYRFDDDRVTRVSFQDVEEDAFGGHVVVVGKGKRKGQHEKSKNQRKGQGIAGTREKNKVGFWKKLWKHWTRVGGGGGEDTRQRTTRLLEYGWGGRTSSAYMLQYVKRSDVPFLYNGN